MAKHTPGPWYRGEVDNSIYIWEECGQGGFIAEVGAEDVDAETHEANARLIVAAPDLLEAIQEAESFIGAMFGSGPDAAIPETVSLPLGVPCKLGAIMRGMKSAILKANGE